MKAETMKLEKCDGRSECDPLVSVVTSDDGYSVMLQDEWGGKVFVALSFVEAETLARAITAHAKR